MGNDRIGNASLSSKFTDEMPRFRKYHSRCSASGDALFDYSHIQSAKVLCADIGPAFCLEFSKCNHCRIYLSEGTGIVEPLGHKGITA